MDPERAAIQDDRFAVAVPTLGPHRRAVGVDDGARVQGLLARSHAPENEERRRREPRRRPTRAADAERPTGARGQPGRGRTRRATAFARVARAARRAPRPPGASREARPPDPRAPRPRAEHAAQPVMCRSKLASSAPVRRPSRAASTSNSLGHGAGFMTSSPSSSAWRSSRRAACSRVHTVPIGIPKAAAISAQLSPSTSARSSVIRLASLMRPSARPRRRALAARTRVGRRGCVCQRSDDRTVRRRPERPPPAPEELRRDPDEPGTARGPAVVARGALGGREEGRVDQVVDVLGVGRGARDEASDRLAVAIVQLAEGADLARPPAAA